MSRSHSSVRIAAVFAVMVSSGCGPTIRSHSTPFQSFAPKPEYSPIAVYGATRPTCPFVEVGLVTAEGRRRHMPEILEAIKKEACELGADAILGVSEATTTKGAVPVGHSAVAIRRQVLSGTAIRFTNPGCVQ